MPALLAFLGSVVAKVFTDRVLAMVALKVILTFLFLIVIPLILNNFVYDLMEILMNIAGEQTTGAGNVNGAMSFSGVAAYLCQAFRLSEALSVVVSAMCLRVSLRMVPFINI